MMITKQQIKNLTMTVLLTHFNFTYLLVLYQISYPVW